MNIPALHVYLKSFVCLLAACVLSVSFSFFFPIFGHAHKELSGAGSCLKNQADYFEAQPNGSSQLVEDHVDELIRHTKRAKKNSRAVNNNAGKCWALLAAPASSIVNPLSLSLAKHSVSQVLIELRTVVLLN